MSANKGTPSFRFARADRTPARAAAPGDVDKKIPKAEDAKPDDRRDLEERQRAVRAGITKRVHPHGLRHPHASELSAERIDLSLISLQLGHSSVATTARYVRALRPEVVLEVVAARAM